MLQEVLRLSNGPLAFGLVRFLSDFFHAAIRTRARISAYAWAFVERGREAQPEDVG